MRAQTRFRISSTTGGTRTLRRVTPSPADLRSLANVALERGPTPAPDGVVVAHQSNADRVELQVMEDRFPPVEPLTREGDVWYGSIPVGKNGAVEYRIAVTRGDRTRTIIDPANPLVARNPFGRNSVAVGPTYVAPDWIRERAASAGSIQPLTVSSAVWGQVRTHLVYLPPGHDPRSATPLLIMHDGPEYLAYAKLGRCLDVLVDRGEIPALAVLLHQPGRRNQEYADNRKHADHIYEEVLPELAGILQLGPVFAGGASLGGIASLSLALRRPGTIEGLVLQSASIVTQLGGPFNRGPVFKQVIPLVEEILESPQRLPSRVVMSCGTYDGLVEDHRLHVPSLETALPALQYKEINAGHHWRCWRDRLAPDLMATFTGGT